MRIILLLCTLFFTPLCWATTTQLEVRSQAYSGQLREVVATLVALPEAAELIADVEQDGVVEVQVSSRSLDGFEAYWDPLRRMVQLNGSRARTTASLLRSVLFEFHNALSQPHLAQLRRMAARGELTKSTYVEAVERMEYGNVRATAALIEQGIAQGIYPESARFPVYDRFEDHYLIQQLTGHSEWIANSYNNINSQGHQQRFVGTIGDPSRISPAMKRKLLELVRIHSLVTSVDQQDRIWGRQELKALCFKWRSNDARWIYAERIFGRAELLAIACPVEKDSLS